MRQCPPPPKEGRIIIAMVRAIGLAVKRCISSQYRHNTALSNENFPIFFFSIVDTGPSQRRFTQYFVARPTAPARWAERGRYAKRRWTDRSSRTHTIPHATNQRSAHDLRIVPQDKQINLHLRHVTADPPHIAQSSSVATAGANDTFGIRSADAPGFVIRNRAPSPVPAANA